MKLREGKGVLVLQEIESVDNKEPKLRLMLDHIYLDKELTLVADSVDEIVDKMKEWLSFSDMDLIKQTKRYKANPESVKKEEKDSGWYFKDSIKEYDDKN